MFQAVTRLADELEAVLSRLDPALLSGTDAAVGVSVFARIERLAAAGRTLLAKRVDETGAWVGSGQRSMAAWMAQQAGTSVGAAIGVTQTSWQLDQQPEVADALRRGELSTTAATEISSAVAAAPGAEADLVALAATSTVKTLRERCVAVRARAVDDAETARRQRARTTYKTWTERDGMVGISGVYPPLVGAAIRAAVDQRTEEIFRSHRRTQEFEPRDKYAADALAQLVLGENPCGTTRGKTRALVRVRVDVAALRRGHAAPGEECEAEGVGPITVADAVNVINDPETIVDAVLTDGTDVLKVKRLDRYIPRALRTALEFRDQKCVVQDCDQRAQLENDHTEDFAKGGPTEYRNVRRPCAYHHHLKTYRGWTVEELADGSWKMHPPDTS